MKWKCTRDFGVERGGKNVRGGVGGRGAGAQKPASGPGPEEKFSLQKWLRGFL